MTEAMGHGVNQRKAIEMTPGEVEAFLAERRNMTMCSISPDGSIHAVAMWYGFLDGCITVETKTKSQKVQNLRRDPRLTLLFEDGDYYEELRGVELVGKAEIVDDPDKLWELGISVYERYNGPYTDELKPILEIMLHKRVAVKLNVERTVSWDHRKLGLPSTRPARVKFAVRQAVAVPPARAMAAYGSPAFYEGRPARDDIAVREVVRHEASRRPDSPRGALRLHRLGVARRAGRGRPGEDVVDHPDRDPPAEARSSWVVLPDHYPDRLSATGTYRFEEGDGGPGSTDVEVEGDLSVRVPIVGRSVERVIVSGLRDYIADEVAGIPDWDG